MKMGKKRIITSIIILFVIFTTVNLNSIANANDLVIQDDGNIELVITTNGVLGESTTAPKEQVKTSALQPQSNPSQQQTTQVQHAQQNQPASPSSNPPTAQIPVKTVPLVSPHTDSVVQINPPINDDKKIQVTITTQTSVPQTLAPTAAPSSSGVTNGNTQSTLKTNTIPLQSNSQEAANPQTTAPTNLTSSSNPPLVTTEVVDQVVAQGSSGKPIISVRSNQAYQLTIQQGTTQVTTTLPLQIDTLTHSLSIPSSNQSASINVLPSEALQGVIDNGLLDTQEAPKAKISLTKDTSGIDYLVSSKKQGKLLGIFPVQSLVSVKLSAQNGKVEKASQSPLFSILGWLIK